MCSSDLEERAKNITEREKDKEERAKNMEERENDMKERTKQIGRASCRERV